MQQYLEAGKVVTTHGVRGEMKLELWCDGVDFLKKVQVHKTEIEKILCLPLASFLIMKYCVHTGYLEATVRKRFLSSLNNK